MFESTVFHLGRTGPHTVQAVVQAIVLGRPVELQAHRLAAPQVEALLRGEPPAVALLAVVVVATLTGENR